MAENTAVATPQAFQERMFNRIREQMGDFTLRKLGLKKVVSYELIEHGDADVNILPIRR